jgi:hypothetical protein
MRQAPLDMSISILLGESLQPRSEAYRATCYPSQQPFSYLIQDNDTRRWPTLHRSNALFSLRQKDHLYSNPSYIK